MSLHAILLRELKLLIAPLLRASQSPEHLEDFMEQAGLGHLLGADFDAIASTATTSLENAIAIVHQIADADPEQAGPSELSAALLALGDVLSLADDFANLCTALQTQAGVVLTSAQLGGLAISPEEILGTILHTLLYRRIEALEPTLLPLGQMLGVITPARAGFGPRVDFAALQNFFQDPQAALSASIGWGSPQIESSPILEMVSSLSFWAGVTSHVDTLEHDNGDEVLSVFLKLAEAQMPGGKMEGGLRVGVRQEAPAAQVEIGVYGDLDIATDVALNSQTRLRIALDAQAAQFPTLLLGPDGATLGDGTVPAGALSATLTRHAAADERLTLLPLGSLGGVYADSVSIGTELDSEDASVAIVARVQDGVIDITPHNPDGFLAMLLPEGGITAPFDLSARLSSRAGFSIEGCAGFDIDIPVTAKALDVLALDAVHLRGTVSASAAQLAVAVSGSGQVGPFTAVVERIGVDATLTWDGSTRSGTVANIGSVSLAMGFTPPNGVGLGLDLGPLQGGGFLALDAEAGRYSGALMLRVEELGLSAFGVVSTKMPDGSDGFSMLAFIRGEFPPMPLGFGFTLNSVGGIIGVNRDLNADALFSAVRAGRIGALLAPEDPVRDAPALIAQAEAIFPVYKGRHVFGPTLQIGWGAPRNLITLDLALGLTLPEPLRILIIGRVRARLPDEELPLIKLNIDVAGILDLGAGKFDMEGRLFDSFYAGIAVTGGFAVQMRWSGRSSFAFSVGGLHPGFQPPAGFPELPRAGVSLAKSRNFTLQLQGYFAITSNSLQFGAAADLIAKASGYGLEAHLGFDALIIFDPFGLDAQLRASARIFKGSKTLMKLGLRGRLRGPGPWSVNGSVTFEILFIDIEIGFSKTFGSAASRVSEQVDVAALMNSALQEPMRWAGGDNGAVLPQPEAQGLLPSKEIQFSQDLLPFETALEHFGGRDIRGARRFTITAISLAGQSVALARAPEDSFAPGSYLSLSEKERLSAPAYEALSSGGAANASQALRNGTVARRDMARRIVLIDAAPGEMAGPQARLQEGWIAPQLEPAPPAPPAIGLVTLRPERFVAGTIDTLQGPAGSYTAARAQGLGVMRHAEL